MSAALAFTAARVAGIEVRLKGNNLSLTAPSEPPTAVLDALRRHKAEIVVMLRPGRDGWSAEDWRLFFEERAGIGELPRAAAEVQAFECCIVE